MLTYTYLTVCGKTSSYIRNMLGNKYHYQISWIIYGSKLFGMYHSFKYPSNVRSGCANTPFLPRDTLYHVTYIYTLSRTVHGRSFCCFDKAYSEIGIFVLFFFSCFGLTPFCICVNSIIGIYAISGKCRYFSIVMLSSNLQSESNLR